MLKRWLLKQFEGQRAAQGAIDAKVIRLELERISDFKFKPTHPSVEDFNILKPKHKEGEIEPLDYNIYSKEGNLVGYADFTGCYFQLVNPKVDDYSNIMPVNAYKGEFIKQASKQCYIIFWMKLEHQSIVKACLRIKGKDVIKCRTEWGYLGGKMQKNYMTNKEDWQRGLDCFIEELKQLKSSSD